jgi:hypothetical protein
MAYPAVTYTFTNGTTASATEVNQNFTDLINGLSDGTKDLSISALTVAGTASLNGAVNIGNATSDDIAVNGYITTALIPKADDSYDLGTAALAWQDAYFEGVVYTDTIQALNGSGLSFKENGGTEVLAVSDAGAVTAGVAGTYTKPLKINTQTSDSAMCRINTGTSTGVNASSSYNFKIHSNANENAMVYVSFGNSAVASCAIVTCSFSDGISILGGGSNITATTTPSANRLGLAYTPSTGILTLYTGSTATQWSIGVTSIFHNA